MSWKEVKIPKKSKKGEPPVSSNVPDKPEQVTHSVNNLKLLELNSADEVRQIMKAVLSDQANSQKNKDERNNSSQNPIHSASNPGLSSQKLTAEDRSITQNLESNVPGKITATEMAKGVRAKQRKRPGRPAKAGPSIKIKRKNSISMIYLGKLKNVVFRKYRRYDTDSDSF